MTKFPTPVSMPRPTAGSPRQPGDLISKAKQAAPTLQDARWSVSPGAVVVWLVAQCGVLALGLLQVRLAASMPSGSTLFPHLVIAGQVGLGALMARFLFRTPATTVVIIAAAWPALLLAGGLAATPTAELLTAGLVVSTWLAAIYFWQSTCRPAPLCTLVNAIAVLLAVGVPLLHYLVVEFGVADTSVVPTIVRFGPLGLAWNALDNSAAWAEALPLGLLLLLGMAIRLALWTRKPT